MNDVYNLPNNEKIILEILNNDYYITKTDEEIAKELGYNKRIYLKAKQVLINKIKNNEELLKNIKKKYPSFSLEQGSRWTFKVVDKLTDKEQRILQLLSDYKIIKLLINKLLLSWDIKMILHIMQLKELY